MHDAFKTFRWLAVGPDEAFDGESHAQTLAEARTHVVDAMNATAPAGCYAVNVSGPGASAAFALEVGAEDEAAS